MPTHYLVDFCVEQVKFETPMWLNLLIMIIYVLFLNNVIVMKWFFLYIFYTVIYAQFL
jgi:hypothetical protein